MWWHDGKVVFTVSLEVNASMYLGPTESVDNHRTDRKLCIQSHHIPTSSKTFATSEIGSEWVNLTHQPGHAVLFRESHTLILYLLQLRSLHGVRQRPIVHADWKGKMQPWTERFSSARTEFAVPPLNEFTPIAA